MSVQFPEAFRFLFDEVADDGKPVRYRAVHGGRGSAKSHSLAQALIIKASQEPLRIGCYREIQKSIRDSVKRLLDDKIKVSGLTHFFESTDTEIRGRNGSLFLFGGLRTNPDAVKSTEGLDIAAVFEADKVSQRSWDLLIPTVRKDGSEIWAEWNPNSPDDPVDQLFRSPSGAPPGSIVRQANWHDNPFFPDVLKQELEWDKKRDPDKFSHVWEGQYLQHSEARVFKNWTVEEFDSPASETYRLGADWGFSVDPSVLVRCWIDGKRLYVDHEAYMVGCEIDNLPNLFDRVPDSRKWFITADSARPETIDYLRRHGFPKINAAIKGARSLEEGVAFLNTFDIVVHPRCKHVIDELTHYRYKQDDLTGKIIPILEDKNNHCLIAGSMVTLLGGDKPIEEVVEGDYALTRGGYRKVLFSGKTGINRSVVKVETTYGSVTCTPNHEIYTENRGYIRADALRYNDEVCIYLGESLCRKKSNIKERFTGVTLRAIDGLTGFITRGQLLAERFGCIARYGLMRMGQFLMGGTFITRMETHSITQSKILSAYPLRSILLGMSGLMPGGLASKRISTRSGILQKRGIEVQKELQSTEKLADCLTRNLSLLRSNAIHAGLGFYLEKLGILIGFAQARVNRHTGDCQGSITKLANANSAEKTSFATSIESNRLVAGRVLTVTEQGVADSVYDLTIDGCHEFFANGVLVHNCIDSLRYACEGARLSVRKEWDQKIQYPKSGRIA